MRRVFASLVAVAALAACSDTLPIEAPRTASLSRSAAPSLPPAERYVVLFKGNAPSDFQALVEAGGGKVDLLHHGSRIAIVSGLAYKNALELDGHASIETIVEDFEYQGVAHAVEPAFEEAVLASADPGAESQLDPATAFFFARQWHHRAIGANVAWAAGRRGSPNVDVAILDSGIDHLYPDLVGLVDMGRARSFVPEGDLTQPFPTDQLLLRDNHLIAQYFPGRPIWSDLNGHGTHVASTVSSLAIVNAGVTSMVKLIPVKVLSARGSGAFTGILQAIVYATDAGAEVINMSLGSLYPRAGNRAFNRVLDAATGYAWKNGVTVVVAAGNDAALLHPSNNSLYGAFCSTKNVICVAATGPHLALNNAGLVSVNGPNFLPSVDFPSIFTNFGLQFIDVAAPGGNWAENAQGQITSAVFVWAGCSKTGLSFIVPQVPPNSPPGTQPAPPFYQRNTCSANPNSTFTTGFVGTSMASPHVAGLVALMVEQYGRNPNLIKSILKEQSDDVVGPFGGKPGKDDFYGWGRINVPRALGL
jgi:subtilisin family serine protease